MTLNLVKRLLASSMLAAVSSAVMGQAPSVVTGGSARIDYPSVAAARAALEAKDGDGVVVTHPDGWMIVNEPQAAAQWSFTPQGHYAYPALVRRTVRRDAAGTFSVEVTSLCEVEAEPCARLVTEFENLNDRVTQSIRARARQGSIQPPR